MTLLDTTLTPLLDDESWSGRIFTGTWIDGRGGTANVVEPATGRTLGRVGTATQDDVLESARGAAAAQAEWATRAPADRARVLRRAGELFEAHAEEIERWIVRESGSIPPKAALETATAASECFEAAALPGHPQGEVLATAEARWSFARRVPVGVVSVIAPFNFPLILSIRAVAPALALGNAVLLKPDPRTAVSGGVVLARVFEEAGLPAGLLHVLPGDQATGVTVVEAPQVAVIAFTGSTAAGRAVGRAAAEGLKRAHLELGGNNALVVLPGADLERAVSAGAFASFMHQGQICMSAGRHLVHESLYEAYVTALSATADRLPVGDPNLAEVAIGPIIDDAQRARIDLIVQGAVRDGAIVEAGGAPDGPFYRPTVLSGLDRHNTAWTEEIFGPVAPVLPFSSVDEAAELVNESAYGLSVGILGDVGQAMTLADRIRSGKIHINEQTVGDEATAPFGGMGDSGTGSRAGGVTANLDAFTEVQWVTVRSEIAPYPF